MVVVVVEVISGEQWHYRSKVELASRRKNGEGKWTNLTKLPFETLKWIL